MSGKYVLPLSLVLTACAQPQASPANVQTTVSSGADWASACEDWDEWDKAGPPFRVHGNTYYVGTCGIGAILIDGQYYDTLIDVGTQGGAQHVLANIRSLGFDPDDIAYIYFSHEHYDHVGGIEMVRAETGATIAASIAAMPVLFSGRPTDADPQAGSDHASFAPATEPVVQIPEDLEFFDDGYDGITPIHTPGHTPGALSWYWESCDEAGQCVTIAYADSLSAVSADDYRFSDHPEYVQAFRDGIARLAALDCDILLTPHPSASGMRDKLIAGDLTGGMDCQAYAADRLERLEARLAHEAGE
ncbi:MBL fold metallo-hydrolase [Aurantiacibacter gangjinensis]|uniref:Uncharacterized protein n=1 Tax=Aurantiacibacter gangjinensis TaxID=502682 RepID=A0A0G9MQ88_9SPHN|nr:MBL fold metallo-hydrolase [Aurantiacibacter gangjinensis]APE28528.1 Metallo-beta-lactamase L1 precursor (Beta-lactamase type II) [Aurantiacibacter gangjinensis]KLE32729.1 hypothetical protein AAW01_01375 [Aurantiacibacter gangjinensis]